MSMNAMSDNAFWVIEKYELVPAGAARIGGAE